ncbi:hypothetical protein [Thiothrix lacustris]|uniref:hypothetical protein n=1 Tax=Thiothrix lacustris TaxID=525917 RepID=UPI0027E531DB|nr:hypothetical protein [Thiothrix lacustris]WMP15964.1 hypothetical protein RCS87_11220 [Thiothrix lacustris]
MLKILSENQLATALVFIVTAFAAASCAETGGHDGSGGGLGGSGKAPAEAVTACASLTEGAACSFSGRMGTVQGSCLAPPQGGGSLACAPAGGAQRPPRPDGAR